MTCGSANVANASVCFTVFPNTSSRFMSWSLERFHLGRLYPLSAVGERKPDYSAGPTAFNQEPKPFELST